MVICTRRGCGVDFDAASSSSSTAASAECKHHPGAPIFHEGLKSWSCCKDVNKPVMEFDQFLAIPGCSSAQGHSTEKQAVPTVKNGVVVPEGSAGADDQALADAAQDVSLVSKDASGKETFGTVVQPLTGNSLLAAQNAAASSSSSKSAAAAAAGAAAAAAAAAKAAEEEQDPTDVNADAALKTGAICKRSGCGHSFAGGARDRTTEECKFHRGSPIFHEGSKGWSCCKRRVLDFNDFLQIEPCTTAKHGHLYLGAPKPRSHLPSNGARVGAGAGSGASQDNADADAEEQVDCRMDHYETPNDIRLTVYAKAVNADRSSIEFHDSQVVFNLSLPPLASSSSSPTTPRRFAKSLNTFAPIVPAECSFTITKFKVDLVLTKAAKGQSWPALEAGDRVFGYGLTFGRDKDK
ncbi:chord-domain-containing protein [Testicularia cyperi]|uniref:Chord-domain-containing protein n=1 Tax=Testicularia cyperi TaxID=1882483 RepID=A0A317XQJ4_9BASI|nr:chord-domain-containing protein [Testicularia cyperi]